WEIRNELLHPREQEKSALMLLLSVVRSHRQKILIKFIRKSKKNGRTQKMSIEKEVAKKLLEIQAVSLNPNHPFTWASGIKSPIYCDNRITLGYPEVRKLSAKNLVKKIEDNYPEAEVIASTATAGIPHAAWVAELMELPMVYIRGKKKDHGKTNQIEGVLKSG